MPKDCPRCGLLNPSEAQQCDCGYEFATAEMRGTLLNERDQAINEDNARQLNPPILIPTGCVGCAVAVPYLMLLGSNSAGAALATVAAILALMVALVPDVGPQWLVLIFGFIALGLDLSIRVLILRVKLMDRIAGPRFSFLPLWLVGAFATPTGLLLLVFAQP